MKTILGLDLGYSCGWALRTSDGAWTSGTWDLAGAGEEPGARIAALGFELTNSCADGRPDLIAFEHVRHPSSGILAAHAWGALWGVLIEFCWRSSVPYLGVNPAEVKAAAGYPSTAGKALLLRAARGTWPRVEWTSDDEVDARYVVVAAGRKLDGPARETRESRR